METQNTTCRYCLEETSEAALNCQYCGEFLDSRTHGRLPRGGICSKVLGLFEDMNMAPLPALALPCLIIAIFFVAR